MNCKLLLPVVFLTLNGFNLRVKYEAEAGAHELVPFGNTWFRSVERYDETANHISNNKELSEFTNVRPTKVKAKESARRTHVVTSSKKRKKKKRNKKKKPVRNPKRFKTTITERDKESNMTDSIEVTKRSKPVDIIVHIKVTE